MNAVKPIETVEELPLFNPLDMPTDMFSASLSRRHNNRIALLAWIKDNLVENVDFGAIPTKKGPSKPSLWKSGAEKICSMLNVSASFPSLKDYEVSALSGIELQQVIIRCELVDAENRIVATGIGARSLKQDFGDTNKALKMATKSSFIDATLKVAALSEIFTLDLEDEVKAPKKNSGKVTSFNQVLISSTQLKDLEKAIVDNNIHQEKLLTWLSKVCVSRKLAPINQFSELPASLVGFVMKKLPEFANSATS